MLLTIFFIIRFNLLITKFYVTFVNLFISTIVFYCRL